MKQSFLFPHGQIRVMVYVLLSLLSMEPVMASDYRECVGRYELSLPGPVEAATTTPKISGDEFIRYPIQFSDGQHTMYSSFGFNGAFRIVQATSLEWVADFLKKKRKFVETNKDRLSEDKEMLGPLVDQSKSFAIAGEGISEFNIYKDGNFINFKAISYDDSQAVVRRRALNTLANLRTRKPYEIPVVKGACLPGIFIVSNGANDFSNIGVTFRLKAHPDVTIYLADHTAGDLSKMTSRQRNEFVWTSDAVGRVIHLHGPLRYRPTIMAGRLGTASFATVTRYDDATDYAYLTTVQGDPNASVDTPDLELLVERTAKNAKGVPPVSGDQLEDIAKAIAASVKRRFVQ